MQDALGKSKTAKPTQSKSTNFIVVFYYYLKALFVAFMNGIFMSSRPCKIDRGKNFSNGITIIGDDTAFGVGDTSLFFQVPGLASHFKQELSRSRVIKQTWNIYNAGRKNSLSKQWLPLSHAKEDEYSYFHETFSKQYFLDSQIVIVLLGFNDARFLYLIRHGISPDETFDNLVKITDVLLNMGKKVFICPVPTYQDHLYNLYDKNIELNDLIINHVELCKKVSDNQRQLFMGPLIHTMNYEYKGAFLYTNDGHFCKRGYSKMAKDFVELMINMMVKIEFEKFKIKLGMDVK